MTEASSKPIFCTLSPTPMAPRLAQIQNLTQRYLRSHRLEGNAMMLTFELAAADELRQIVALEEQCCAFLDFKLYERAGFIDLHIVGQDQQGSDTQWLFSHFLPASSPAAAPACACCKG
jgi:hypothetical protein